MKTPIDTLNQKEAFVAMINFLELYWQLTNSEDVAILLGSLTLQVNGMPNDIGMWKEWGKCCEQAKNQ